LELTLTEEPLVSERDLILRTQAGEKDAFGELVNRYMRRAYYSALGLVGSPEDAMDLSQEAFVRAYRARARIDPDLPFFTWLYQILRRLCFNFVRDRRTRRRKLDHASDWLADQASDRLQVDPEAMAQRAELRQSVRDGIERLPDREREVLVLREFEGLRYREIAALLGIPMGTVMSRLYAARKHLVAVIEETK